MEPVEDICRCNLSSETTCKLSEILTRDLFTKMFNFRFDGQNDKNLSFLLWDKNSFVIHLLDLGWFA